MSEIQEVRLPDIGDFDEVSVAEVLVSPGDRVEQEDPLITLESDKASMEVPSDKAGVIEEVRVAVGDKVSQDAVIVTLKADAKTDDGEQPSQAPAAKEEEQPKDEDRRPQEQAEPQTEQGSAAEPSGAAAPTGRVHASPSVRRLAREKGVDLTGMEGSGRKGRILKDDVESAASRPAPGFSLPEAPQIDFSKFGEVETQPLNRIRRLSGRNVHRSWVGIPHVTQFDEADITELEEFRKAHDKEAREKGFKLTPVAFLIKASVAALKEFPDFNSSLHADGDKLILKKYFHIGVAVDTPQGLMVPVIRNADQKGLFQLAQELVEVAERTREGKARFEDLQGATFSISSLGGIGGTAFTPIINSPQVAILGASRHYWKPVYRDGDFVPRLMLPLSLSYDHRVIDGAAAARFTSYLSRVLSDIRRLLL